MTYLCDYLAKEPRSEAEYKRELAQRELETPGAVLALLGNTKAYREEKDREIQAEALVIASQHPDVLAAVNALTKDKSK